MGWRRQIISGGILAIFYLLLVFGGLSATFAEGRASDYRQVNTEATATENSTQVPLINLLPSPQPSLIPSPTPNNCHPPEGWTAITILPGDTLISLAETYHSTSVNLAEANCLLNLTLSVGTIFYIPSGQSS